GWWSGRKEQAALTVVQDYVKSDAAVKRADVGHQGVAELHLALADYRRLLRRDDGAQEAKQQLQQALAHLGEVKGQSDERDAVLADVALGWIELGGSGEDVDRGRRLKWEEVHKGLRSTLIGIRDEEARLMALRAVCRRLIAHDQAALAIPLTAAVTADGVK